MHQQPNDRSCTNEAIGGDHYGPINVSPHSPVFGLDRGLTVARQIYMAKVDDATSAVGSSAKWFKAAEMGMPSNNPDYWATGE